MLNPFPGEITAASDLPTIWAKAAQDWPRLSPQLRKVPAGVARTLGADRDVLDVLGCWAYAHEFGWLRPSLDIPVDITAAAFRAEALDRDGAWDRGEPLATLLHNVGDAINPSREYGYPSSSWHVWALLAAEARSRAPRQASTQTRWTAVVEDLQARSLDEARIERRRLLTATQCLIQTGALADLPPETPVPTVAQLRR